MNELQWRELVEATKKGDKQAFEKLYRETERAVYFTCLKLVAKEDTARDMMQDAFMTALERLETLDDGAKFPMWINRIAVNKCMHSFRKKSEDSLDEQTEQGFDPKDDESFIPEEYVTDETKRKIIMDIINKVLSDVQRQAIIMYYYDDMSLEEIAEVTGDKVKTVSARLCSARERIKEAVLIYERDNEDRLHAIVPVPILTQILFKEAASIGVPDIMPMLLNAEFFTVAAAASANTISTSVIAGGSKMTGFFTGKVIAAIAAGVVAVGGVTTAVVLSKNSDKDTSSKTSISASSGDAKGGSDSKGGNGGSDSSESGNGSGISAAPVGETGSVINVKGLNFILPPRYEVFPDNTTSCFDYCDKYTVTNEHYGIIQLAYATADAYRAYSLDETKKYFEEQFTYIDFLDQIHGFFWVDENKVESSEKLKVGNFDFIREAGTYKITCDKKLKYDVPYVIYYGKVDLDRDTGCPIAIIAYSTDNTPEKKKELATSIDNMVKGLGMSDSEAKTFAESLNDDYLTYTGVEPTYAASNGTKGNLVRSGYYSILVPQNWYIAGYRTGDDDPYSVHFYSYDYKNSFRFRCSDELNTNRWLDNIIESYKDKPENHMEDVSEFTLNNIKWHGVKFKTEVKEGEPALDEYVIIGQDQAKPSRWFYLMTVGTTCDSGLTKDIINSIKMNDTLED